MIAAVVFVEGYPIPPIGYPIARIPPLPAPSLPRILCKEESKGLADSNLADIQRRVLEAVNKNREVHHLHIPVSICTPILVFTLSTGIATSLSGRLKEF